jgi:hypothetical protein
MKINSSLNQNDLGNFSKEKVEKTPSNFYPVLAQRECLEINSLQLIENLLGLGQF